MTLFKIDHAALVDPEIKLNLSLTNYKHNDRLAGQASGRTSGGQKLLLHHRKWAVPLVLATFISGCHLYQQTHQSDQQANQRASAPMTDQRYKLLGTESGKIPGLFYVTFKDDFAIRKAGKSAFRANGAAAERLATLFKAHPIQAITSLRNGLSEEDAKREKAVLQQSFARAKVKREVTSPLSSYYIQFSESEAAKALLEDLQASDLVASVEQAQMLAPAGTEYSSVHQFSPPPADPGFSEYYPPWNSTVYPYNDPNYYHFNRHGVIKGWGFYTATTGSSVGAKVAVIDTKFTASPLDAINYDTTAAAYYADSGGTLVKTTAWSTTGDTHGGFVASVLGAAKNNGVGWCGVAPGVSIIPLATDNSELAVAQAITDVANNNLAKVINISLETLTTGKPVDSLSSVRAAINFAATKKITTIIAAGNSAQSLAYSYTLVDSDAVVVGGLGKTDGREWASSNYGSRIDVSAAAEAIAGSAATLKSGLGASPLQGTSYSTAIVSGLASYMYGMQPTLTPQNVQALLFVSSDVAWTNSPKAMGRNMDQTYYSVMGYGSRMVDYYSALRMLAQAATPVGNYVGRVFNSNPFVLARLTTGSWSAPLMNAGGSSELVAGGGTTGVFEFRSSGITGQPRTYGASWLHWSPVDSYMYVGVKTYGFAQRRTPQNNTNLGWLPVSSDYTAGNIDFNLSLVSSF